MNNILITGATGFLGSELIKEILLSSDCGIYALVRAGNVNDAEKRLFSVLDGKINSKRSKKRIQVCVGDISKKGLGLEKNTADRLIDNVDVIFNSAALTILESPLDKIRKINVNGTKNVLDFALSCKKLNKVNHISTAYVAGKRIGVFKENDLNLDQEFNNTYEQSKFEAELLVNEYRGRGLDIDVFRPSIILGRYKDGATTNFQMFYQPLHIFSLELFDRIPAIKNSRANVINVDIAAKAIFLIASTGDTKNANYHIVSSKVLDFDYVVSLASEYFGFKKPEFVSLEKIDIRKEYSAIKRKMIKPYIPYFNYLAQFDMSNTMKRLDGEKFAFPEFDEKNFMRLFEYCANVKFIRRRQSVVTG